MYVTPKHDYICAMIWWKYFDTFSPVYIYVYICVYVHIIHMYTITKHIYICMMMRNEVF